MNEKHVRVTGMGAVSAAGKNVPESMKTMSTGLRRGSMVTLFNTSLPYPVFEVSDLSEDYCLEGSRTLGLALSAVDEALREAHLNQPLTGFRVGVCMGTTVASQLNDIAFYKAYRESGAAPMTSVNRYLDGNLADFIARKIRAKGPCLTVVNACSSGTDAIGVALSWLRGALCDIVLAGGADELNRVPFCGFGALGIVSSELCAPFDRDREGLNLGEGAGVLVLETADSARKRGRDSTVSLLGYGSSGDAYHLTAPRPDGAGLRMAVKRALHEAKIQPEDISFVNVHGTATPDNDKIEGKVLGELFGAGLKMVSTKGYTGHTLGAAGGLEAVFAAAGLIEGWIPGSAGFKTPDHEIGVSPVVETTGIQGDYALSTSLAFGGNNGALIFGRDA